MYTPYYMHPLFSEVEKNKVRERWYTQCGEENACHDKVVELIKDGGDKHMLNYDFFEGKLPTIEDDLDLRGIRLWKLKIDFGGERDNFKGLDFKYSEMWHLCFKRATFYSTSLSFSTMYNCRFEDCAFAFTGFMGAKLEKCKFVRCEFPEHTSFENVMFKDCTFDQCFLGKTTPFSDCYFSDLTSISNIKEHSFHYGEKYLMPPSAKAGLYRSIQLAYEAAGADDLAMNYYWMARKSFTRNNLSITKRFFSTINEYLTGYGMKPLRPLLLMLIINISGTLLFSCYMPLEESILFTAGGFFTFGAFSEHLIHMGLPLRLVYVSLSFMGIILSGLFLATLANIMFRSSIPNQTVNMDK